VSSPSAKAKKATHRTSDGLPVHSLETLLEELGTLCRNRCRVKHLPDSPAFYQDTEPTSYQAEVFRRLGVRPVN